MRSTVAKTKRVSMEEYFRLEELSEVRHDFVDGDVLAMSGGSSEHCLIGANVIGETRQKLKSAKKPCKVYTSDFLIGVPDETYFHYPDATVVCGPLLMDQRDGRQKTLINPLLVFEILSPSTANYDRGEKFDHYRLLESFREYVLIFQDKPEIHTFYKHDDGTWAMAVHVGKTAKISLQSVGISIDAAEVYDGIDFTSSEKKPVKRSRKAT